MVILSQEKRSVPDSQYITEMFVLNIFLFVLKTKNRIRFRTNGTHNRTPTCVNALHKIG